MEPKTPPRSVRRWYGFGQLGEGMKNEGFAVFLLFYYTQVLGLPGTLAGQAILLALLFDAATDPWVGVWSDRLQSRWGRRHPFLYASALPGGAAFACLFWPPQGLSPWGLFGWLLGFTCLARFAMTLFNVPHLALGAELSTDYQVRTEVTKQQVLYRRLGRALMGGLGLAVFLRPTPQYPKGQLNPEAYPAMGVTVGVLICLSILWSAWRTHHWIPHLHAPSEPPARGILAAIFHDSWEALQNRSFRAIFLGLTLAAVAFGLMGALALHFATYFWGISTRQLFLWGLCAVLSQIAGFYFWTWLSHRWDKKPTFLLGIVTFTLFAAGAYGLKLAGIWPPKNSPLYLPLFILTTGVLAQFSVASIQVIGRSMMADVTDQDALQYGQRREGIFFGAVSFAGKASFGIGSLLAGLLIDAIGLTPGTTPANVGPQVATHLGLAAALSLAALMGLSLLFFSAYDIDRKRHSQIQHALQQQRSHTP